MARLVSEVYGDALYELALEYKDRTDSFFEEANELLKIFEENPEFIQVMVHPNISGDEKQKLLDETFKGKVSDEVLGLFHELERKGHYSEVKNVLNYFCEKIRQYRQIGRASVITPMELGSDKKQEVQKKLLETTSYKSLDIDYSVDSSLIGGMIIRIGDRVVDSSIKSKLENLSHELSRIQLKVGETDS
ncbi:MAG: ATP synthase F1 subunit delta [Lachnospiraceae bacterium]|nr:ATP synthase F1 subunit delta [Lachnospiraceae bacterium]